LKLLVAVHTKAVGRRFGSHPLPLAVPRRGSRCTSLTSCALVARGRLFDLFHYRISRACVESASTYELKAIIESPKPLTPTICCLMKELKTARVARSMSLFVVYAASRLPSLTSFCIGVSNPQASLSNVDCGYTPERAWCREEHACGSFGTWGRCP